MIFVSTGGVRNSTAIAAAHSFFDVGIGGVELSGGRYDAGVDVALSKLSERGVVVLHNYYPPPKEPFVINLASNDPEILKESENQIIRSIKLASQLETNRFAFHAGFLVDPNPEELGKSITVQVLADREKAIERFVKTVSLLADIAKKTGTQLLIENNVLSKENYKKYGGNPFLMADGNEIERIMKLMPSNVGLLMDVAHLKVSANSLGFDRIECLQRCSEWTRGYHLSENDAESDLNQPVETKSWMWEYLEETIDYITLEVYDVAPERLRDQVNMASACMGLTGSRRY